jgi:hypothetical protein
VSSATGPKGLITGIDGEGVAVSMVPMRLFCPACGQIHIDVGVFETKPHHTHSCQECGNTWRPAVVYTVGVKFLPGFKNVPASPEGQERKA